MSKTNDTDGYRPCWNRKIFICTACYRNGYSGKTISQTVQSAIIKNSRMMKEYDNVLLLLRPSWITGATSQIRRSNVHALAFSMYLYSKFLPSCSYLILVANVSIFSKGQFPSICSPSAVSKQKIRKMPEYGKQNKLSDLWRSRDIPANRWYNDHLFPEDISHPMPEAAHNAPFIDVFRATCCIINSTA